MKKIRLLAVALMLFTGTAIIQQKATAQVSVSFQVFYDDLSPYGDWVDYDPYGYVWVPRVSRGFIPYASNGYWVFTYDGWTWVSNYSWGWAPFHYGRWFYDGYYGWVWVPDNEWGPGWVTWRTSNDYYGWAPITPGISIDIAYSSGYNLPYNRWTFVRNRYFGSNNIYNYYIDNSTNINIFNNTTVINNIQVNNRYNTRYNAGPDRVEAERRTGRRFTPVAIKEASKPAQNLSGNQLQLYRPRIQHNVTGQRAAPKTVKAKDIKAQPQKTVDNTQQQREQQRVQQQQKVQEQQQQKVQQQQQKTQQQQREQQRSQQQQKVQEQQQQQKKVQQQQREQQRVQQQQQQQRVQQQQKVQEQQQEQKVQQQQREQQRVQEQQQQQREQQRAQQQQQQQREQQRVQQQQQQQKVQQQQREQQRVQQQQQQQQQQQKPQQERSNPKPPKKGNG